MILAGGASSRMGQDKASLLIEGRSLVERIADELQKAGFEPFILGGRPLLGRHFIPDETLGSGPLAALRGFAPPDGLVFVSSCDLPLFRSSIPLAFEEMLADFDCVIPRIAGSDQPLCALYRSSCWLPLRQDPPLRRVMDWVDRLTCVKSDEPNLLAMGIQPSWCRGANTPDELHALLALEE